jgi:enediyne biosynthesis protein E4
MRRQNVWILLAVFSVVGVLAILARLPDAPPGEAERLASRFRFAWQPLPAAPMPAGGVSHQVNRTAPHLHFYLYQLGSSAALGDLDGDGLPNDLCLTDIRAKALTVSPVPGTGARYPPFTLEAGDRVDRATEHPSVCRITDMNQDGLADLFVAFWGRAPLLLLRRATEGLQPGAPLSMKSFAIVDLVQDGAAVRWWTTTATFTDIDGDGRQDIVVGNYYPDGAELTDGTSSRPFEMNDTFSRARNGGTSRIFLHVRGTSGAAPGALYRDAGDVIPENGERAWVLAVGAADLDRDGLSDLYIANDFGPDQFLWNRSRPGKVELVELKGEGGFAVPESMMIGHDSFKGMSIDYADVNNDGLFDMSVSNIASPFALQESHFLWTSTGKGGLGRMAQGIAPWIESSGELGVAHSAWGWDTRFEDFDNDGVVELVQATGLMKGTANRWPDLAQVGAANDVFVRDPASWPKVHVGSEVDGFYQNPFWVLGSDGRYVDVAAQLFPGYTPNTRGIAVADVDGDGDPDLVHANHWENSDYIENQTAAGNPFLGLHLLLPVTGAGAEPPAATRAHAGHPAWREGTPAIGAFVEAEIAAGRSLIRQVDGGNGHSGQRSPEVRFGLGKTSGTQIPVRITWRDAQGALHNDALSLAPGWHTVVLAAKGGNS